MKIAFYGDSLTAGIPGASYFDVLSKRLPEHTLINYGKGGDTALSLHRRIVRANLLGPVDLAFVWIGVNDVLVRLSPLSPIIKTVLGQPWAQGPAAFREHYRALLETLCPQAGRVITVPPLFIGEDLSNGWNREIEPLIAIIKELSGEYGRVAYLDLRAVFAAEMASRIVSDYLPTGVGRVALDALTLHTIEQIDRMASSRGLHFTLDGVHLNGAGAALAAETFAGVIARSVGRA